MKFEKSQRLLKILDGLFLTYYERVPDVKKITKAMVNNLLVKDKSDIINDHIAFRTMGINTLGVKSFEKIFLHYGYIKKDNYRFNEKKLNAFWYSPPSPELPRVFISELCVDELSPISQKIINHYLKDINLDPVDLINLDNPEKVISFFRTPLWDLPKLSDYKLLLKESEYAAWVIYNRYYLNHYTISVHNLPEGYNELSKFNDFLINLNIKLNDSGGLIKTSKDGLLLQSSTIANTIYATFAKGDKFKIAGSYVEFAERKILPEFLNLKQNKINFSHRRDGFEVSNADRIFESTFTNQVKRS
jgi:hypothetical protein